MRRLLFIVAVVLIVPAAANAQTCTASDGTPGDSQITVTITGLSGDPSCSSITTATNMATDSDECTDIDPISGNQFTLTGTSGASEWEAQFSDSGGAGTFTCGPFTNADGLPVELLSFEIE